jgi:hypothetical protein
MGTHEHGTAHAVALFLVERYVPSASKEHLAAQTAAAEVAARELRGEGMSVRYLWSTFLPSEETCLCLFEAPDRWAVEEVNRRAGFPFDRVVEAVDVLRPDDRSRVWEREGEE